MNARALGLIALAGGLGWTAMSILYVAIGETMWTGGLLPLWFALLVLGVVGFPLSAIGLAFQVQDRLTALSPIGAVVLVIGALAMVSGTSNWIVYLLLPLGSALVLWDVAGTGVISRWVPIAQMAAVVGIAVARLAGLPFDGEQSERAISVLVSAPFVLSWIALGVSLARRVQPPESASRGSPA